ncbi:MAG: hypothetical protein ACK4UZ_01400 [Rhizobium rhizophilum]
MQSFTNTLAAVVRAVLIVSAVLGFLLALSSAHQMFQSWSRIAQPFGVVPSHSALFR